MSDKSFGKIMNPAMKLIQALDELIELLDSDDESHWSAWMRSARDRLAADDGSGIEKILGAYGGMGSFNDLILGQRTFGSRLEWKPGAQALNGRLEELRSGIYDLAIALRRAKG